MTPAEREAREPQRRNWSRPKRSRHFGLVRCLQLWRTLNGRRYAPSLSELAEGYGVSARTIRRDLIALEDAGFMVPKWRTHEDCQ